MAKLPTVAIVGRPNVGKSTLFNRLVGKKLALVDDRPGVTRDRREGDASLLGLEFRIIDTAGFEDEDPDTLPGRMRAQTQAAVVGADVALFMVDARAGHARGRSRQQGRGQGGRGRRAGSVRPRLRRAGSAIGGAWRRHR
jgi:small GTP-binding protein